MYPSNSSASRVRWADTPTTLGSEKISTPSGNNGKNAVQKKMQHSTSKMSAGVSAAREQVKSNVKDLVGSRSTNAMRSARAEINLNLHRNNSTNQTATQSTLSAAHHSLLGTSPTDVKNDSSINLNCLIDGIKSLDFNDTTKDEQTELMKKAAEFDPNKHNISRTDLFEMISVLGSLSSRLGMGDDENVKRAINKVSDALNNATVDNNQKSEPTKQPMRSATPGSVIPSHFTAAKDISKPDLSVLVKYIETTYTNEYLKADDQESIKDISEFLKGDSNLVPRKDDLNQWLVILGNLATYSGNTDNPGVSAAIEALKAHRESMTFGYRHG